MQFYMSVVVEMCLKSIKFEPESCVLRGGSVLLPLSIRRTARHASLCYCICWVQMMCHKRDYKTFDDSVNVHPMGN